MPQFESRLNQAPDPSREAIKIAHSEKDAELIKQAAADLASLGIVARQFPETDEGEAWAKEFVRERMKLWVYPEASEQAGYTPSQSDSIVESSQYPIQRAYEEGRPIFRVTATKDPDLLPFYLWLDDLRSEAR